MKRILIIVALFSLANWAFSEEETLLTINGEKVPKSYFEYLYNKNNSAQMADKKTLPEYLELFKIFKLKVAEAEAHKLDTVSSFKNELSGYRRQLAAPFLSDTNARNKLVKLEYERMKQDVDVSHILIKIEGNKTPADTLAAYKKALAIEERLKKEDFEKVAKEVSDDPSAKKNGGNLGYLSAMWTVYPFETLAYTTPVGQISKPVQTMFGYHILKVNATRPGKGKIHVAHIMKFTNDTLPEKNAKAEADIKALYAKAKAGEDFGKLAKENSEDTYSAKNNGELAWFGPGNMVKSFEDAAYALSDTGQISAPIKTEYGWHIIKLLGKKPIDTYQEASVGIKAQIGQTDRAQMLQDAFVGTLKREYHYELNQKQLLKLEKLAQKVQWKDSLFIVEAQKTANPLFKYADKTCTTNDFVTYMKDKKLHAANIQNNLDAYVGGLLINYKDSHLEQSHSDFRNLMQEYRDGILLFNISNSEVWEKASADSVGLRSFFEKNKAKYKWDVPHFKGRVLSCKDKKTVNQVKLILKKEPEDSIDKRLAALNTKDNIVVKSEKNLFAKGDNKVVDYYAFNTGAYKAPDDFKIVWVDGKVLDSPESYLDVKGAVIQDYQTYLEQEWIKSLQAKYPVVVNEEVLKTVNKN
jgi:peptidyl-prolyl cis-trans isomerase SurA